MRLARYLLELVEPAVLCRSVRLRIALLMPLVVGCAHALYDSRDSDRDTMDGPGMGLPSAGAMSTFHSSLPDSDTDATSAGTAGTDMSSLGGASSGGASGAGAGSAGLTNGSSGYPVGGAVNGGGASAGATSASSAGAGATSAGSAGTGSAGAGSAGTGDGGATSSGSAGASATNPGCMSLPTWKATPYLAGDRIQSRGKIYRCKTFPESGWCGLADAYAPPSGFAWADAWDLIGPCP